MTKKRGEKKRSLKNRGGPAAEDQEPGSYWHLVGRESSMNYQYLRLARI